MSRKERHRHHRNHAAWRRRWIVAALMLGMGIPGAARAAASTLEITMPGGAPRRFSAAALLARRDVIRLDLSGTAERLGRNVPAVPLSALIDTATDLSFTATDAFSAELSATVFATAKRHGVTPMIAIEEARWPLRDGHDIGPFALVWQGDGGGSISPEQWIDSLAAIAPSIGIALPHAQDATAQAGSGLFVANCLPCHRLAGIGNGRKGRDLALPVNLVRQMGGRAFYAAIRHPRPTPPVSMRGYTAAEISDSDIDLLWRYLSSLRQSSIPQQITNAERNSR